MPDAPYRPWGMLPWLLSRGPTARWHVVGCFGTEQRSLAAWRCVKDLDAIDWVKLLRIRDIASRHTALAEDRIRQRLDEFAAAGGKQEDISEHELMESHELITRDLEGISTVVESNVLVDVSTLPKRFFFPLIKIILKRPRVRNLIITYTIPQDYTSDKLSENCEDWAHIPLFSGSYSREPSQMLIVNVGFAPMGLQEEVEHGTPGVAIKLLFPFPASAQAVTRSWEFVRRLQKHRSEFDLYRVDSRDVSDAFDRLLSLTAGGKQRVIMAPFGPKPISVAMCIFATLTDSEVFYTQPTVYHPDYSIGVAKVNGIPETHAYWVRLEGKNLFCLP